MCFTCEYFGSKRTPDISVSTCATISRWILIAAMPQWLYRWAVPSKTELCVDDCSCLRIWQPAKPRMEQKMTHHLENDMCQLGMKELFTEDGWTSRKYTLSSMLLDCYLFTHPQHETLIFKKVGGPIVTLHLGEVVDSPFTLLPCAAVHTELRLMDGSVLTSKLMPFTDRLEDFLDFSVKDRRFREKFTLWDLESKEILSPWGEVIHRGLKFDFVWRCYQIHEAGSIEHAFCDCQRSLKRQRLT